MLVIVENLPVTRFNKNPLNFTVAITETEVSGGFRDGFVRRVAVEVANDTGFVGVEHAVRLDKVSPVRSSRSR